MIDRIILNQSWLGLREKNYSKKINKGCAMKEKIIAAVFIVGTVFCINAMEKEGEKLPLMQQKNEVTREEFEELKQKMEDKCAELSNSLDLCYAFHEKKIEKLEKMLLDERVERKRDVVNLENALRGSSALTGRIISIFEKK